jgi:hypothetical protein
MTMNEDYDPFGWEYQRTIYALLVLAMAALLFALGAGTPQD